MTRIKAGDCVHIHYEGRFEDGEVFDSSAGRDPITFVAGSEDLIPGFSTGVIDMAVGEKKTLTLPPDQAYGPVDPARIQSADLGVLPEGAKVGDRLEASTENQAVHVVVTKIDETGAVLDGNHPLAGKTLVFDVEVVRIDGASAPLSGPG